MVNPLVCIVTINYNSSAHTIEMVQSVYESDYSNIRIIVVDNASAEEEYRKLNVISEKAVIIKNQENLGFSGGNNVGIRRALEFGADYIMIVNNDTVLEKNAISIMMQAVCKESIDIICPKILNYYNRKKLNYAGGSLEDYKGGISIWGLGKEDNGQFDEPQRITFADGCCALASAEVWKDVNLMDERYFLYYEDVALSKSFNLLGKKIYYWPEAVIYHKESTSTVKYSDNYQYYLCRNRLMYIKESIKWPMKYVAYGYTFLYILKNLKRKNFQINNVKEAIKDFNNGIYGRRRK